MNRIFPFLSKLSRREKVALQLVFDATLIAGSFVAAMILRLESLAFVTRTSVWIALLMSTAATLCMFYVLGLYRSMVRFVTGTILVTIGKGALVASLTLVGADLALGAGIPRSAPVIYGFFICLSVAGLRFTARAAFRKPNTSRKRPVIIYGAGDAGMQLLSSLFHSREFTPVALVDDDPRLHNLSISGIRVHPASAIPALIRETDAKVVLLAIPSASRARRREIVTALEGLQVEIKTIPGLSDIISAKARISELRTISAEDLLGRDPVEPDPELLAKSIRDRVVMVSGAGGSIGSELCRQILGLGPRALVLFEMSEFALYKIEEELSEIARRKGLSARVIPVLGSVQHARRLETVIAAFGVETIYHAAAYKHVPLVEENVVEGIRNNVFGTQIIADAARKQGVRDFILISTDKAVRPANVMGATKRIAELICQARAQDPAGTVFSMVRFGNVLGSSGSVIPRFRAQIESGGPVTVTHPDITRYFMTIAEASQLVIQAGAMAQGGDVFVLDMGQPVKIVDVAVEMVKLNGLKPYFIERRDEISSSKGDVPICYVGLRKGEKLHEELLIGNNPSPTRHPRIMTASEISLPADELAAILDRLFKACEAFDLPAILQILRDLPLDYAPKDDGISDLLWQSEHRPDDAPAS